VLKVTNPEAPMTGHERIKWFSADDEEGRSNELNQNDLRC
jgi:hypothetical protein